MNTIKSIFVISLLLACSAFADTLYLKNGQEISDATVIEIGVSEVKYKIGKREVPKQKMMMAILPRAKDGELGG